MFEWNWESIASECTQYLGPAGYGYVQISPPQETVTGDAWWTDYQPVSYKLENRRGNREALAAMIETCHQAGVKVIADAVINHMTGSDSGTGSARTAYTHYNYPDVYDDSSFHHCGLAPNDDIQDYNNREQVQTCELSNLADLATEKPEVQEKIAAYLNDLASLGVDGFRLDASKHMATGDIGAILSRLSTPPQLISQEVIFGPGEPILPSEYTANGGVQEFRYTYALKSAFLQGGISTLTEQIPGAGWLTSEQAMVFVLNHDTQRHDATSLTYKDAGNVLTLAHVFMLAFPYGTPSVLSAYEFEDSDAGPPKGGVGACYGAGGVEGWLCEHRWVAIAGMNAFHVAVTGEVGNVLKGSQQQLAFSRGSSGYVAINNDDAEWVASFTTGLPQGVYCNVYEGARNSTGCAGSTVEVNESGVAALTIPPRTATAFYVGAEAGTASPAPSSQEPTAAPTSSETTPSSSETESTGTATIAAEPTSNGTPAPQSSPAVTFSVLRNTTYGNNVYVVGSVAALGNWDTSKAVKLNTDKTTYPKWTVSIPISDSAYDYKYFVKTSSGGINWEADPNRSTRQGTDTELWH
ncbi:alpha-amylase-domain-containing protein [Auriculariales sp. MPI-PUGE-AT-0066]|nr:alpha-amylase-domain-containing protein [Auriculariales sp. MPI-PUGE-AT-0066]